MFCTQMAHQIIDDSDPAVLYSTGQWSAGGVSGEFYSTTTFTQIVGANATLIFQGAPTVCDRF